MDGNHNEISNITIDADNIGTTDGIDINGDYNYVHDSYVRTFVIVKRDQLLISHLFFRSRMVMNAFLLKLELISLLKI